MITRFAPSPTGPLHLGHAYSAILAHDLAMAENGTFLLRIEDIDQTRCRPEWEAQIYDDLHWLGLWWPEPVLRQSERKPAYDAALDRLWGNLIYPCTCSRKDIVGALSAPQEGAPQTGADGLIYPGTCRENMAWERTFPESYPRPADATLRLNMNWATALSRAFRDRVNAEGRRALASFIEAGAGSGGQRGLIEFGPEECETRIGDIVLARREMGTSYHLSVVIDDAAQGVTTVVRGADLFEATKIHVVLQGLLDLPTPTYHHHRLIRDATGKRLAKRDDAKSIARFRAEGATPADIRAMVGL